MIQTNMSDFQRFTTIDRNHPDYAHYWMQSEIDHVSTEHAENTDGDSVQYSTSSLVERRFYSYFPRCMKLLYDSSQQSETGFFLFDAHGCLIESFGGEDTLKALDTCNMGKNTVWSLDRIGPNAVTVGLKEWRRLISRGTDNYTHILHKYVIYFAPLIIRESTPPFQLLHLGGLATVLPLKKDSPDAYFIVASLAHNMILNQHHLQRHYRQYQLNEREVLTVDTSLQPGDSTITYAPKSLIALLGATPGDYYKKPLRTLIDPLPRNSELWDILTNHSLVTDMEISLSVQGTTHTIIVSTDVFYQPGLNLTGSHFFITTPQLVSRQISAKVGNSAARTFDNLIGQSVSIKSTIRRARMIANTQSNLMLLGESGVGKDVFAQAIHNSSSRKGKPFIAINCGALPRDLIASELFGYDSGAFTGAKRQGNIGKFELANGGTLFLDEIGELPLDLQATLLRAVEQKRITRLGSNKEIDVDVKIISATNANLMTLIEEKRFREDLYYRLSTILLNIPPLRERDQDIILLAEHFIQSVSARIGRTDGMYLSNEAKSLLMQHQWKGNVRELQNLIEGIVQIYPDPVILPEHILENLRTPLQPVQELVPPNMTDATPLSTIPDTIPLPVSTPIIKKQPITQERILDALDHCGDNRKAAAEYLGISRRTLYRYINQFHI